MNKRGFLEMPFSWIFSLIVGAIVLVLAIYVATRIIPTEEMVSDVQTSKDIGILLNPLEIGFESGKTTYLELPKETRIYNGCDDNEDKDFGKQKLQISQKSFGEWSETEIEVGFLNKYIFSPNPIEGKKFIIFSKPFEFPFKVADLIYIIPENKKYCFVGASEEIINETISLRLNNSVIINRSTVSSCPDGSERVCFRGRTGCNISVNLQNKTVKKIQEDPSNFEGDALMYAAIFSDHDIYECQVKRLMLRVSSLATLYENKANFVAGRGCNSYLKLEGLRTGADSFSNPNSNSNSLSGIVDTMEDIKQANSLANCRLW